MKKKLSILFIVTLIICFPMKTFAATDYRGGLLDGVDVYITADALASGTLAPEVNDNNESTSITMSGWNVGTNKDHIVKNFDSPVKVSSLRINASNSINVGFYDKNNRYIKVNGQDLINISADQADGRLITIPETEGIYKVFLFNSLKESVDIREFNIYDVVKAPEPLPNPDSVGRAILVVTMINGLEKEYDLPMSDVNAFLNWYDARDAGSGPAKFAINKYSNNKGPFSKRTDYVIFDKILTFEVSEYSTN